MSYAIVLLLLAAGLAAGNFTYQWLQDAPLWSVAVDRSYFQSVALLAAWIVGMKA